MAKKAVCQIIVAGKDVTSRFDARLISLRIADKEGTHSDTAEIEVDNRDSAISIPRTGDPMQISLGWDGDGMSVCFSGKVDEVRSRGSRSGRTVTISAKGIDTEGKAKEGQQLNIDDASVKTALEKAGKAAGITSIKIDPSLERITRPWWGLNNESFLHFGERIAREIGGTFKIKDDKAILAAKTGGSVSGKPMPVITAAWGVNLTDWDMSPVLGRSRYKEVQAEHYDTKSGTWKKVKVRVNDEGAKATHTDRTTHASEGAAKNAAESKAMDAEKEKGGGSLSIDGTASAVPGATCIVSGADRIANGTWRVEGVDHDYSRSGWTTKVSVKQPQGDKGAATGKTPS